MAFGSPIKRALCRMCAQTRRRIHGFQSRKIASYCCLVALCEACRFGGRTLGIVYRELESLQARYRRWLHGLQVEERSSGLWES
jgi:hypothetical protein